MGKDFIDTQKINAIGCGLITLQINTDCWIIDIYTGEKLLKIDNKIIKN